MSDSSSPRAGGHRLCRVDDVPVGGLRAFDVAGRRVLVVRTAGGFHALGNRCPHQGAPLEAGRIDGTFVPAEVGTYRFGRDGEILRCPWHRWEFDVTTGCTLHDPGVRVARYDVRVDGDDVVLALPGRAAVP